MKETLEERLARVGEEAEAESGEVARPLPSHAKVSRPNRARSRVLQVRLNPEEMEAVEAIAARRGVPVSTVAREQLLQLIEQDRQSAEVSLSAIAQTLSRAAAQLRDHRCAQGRLVDVAFAPSVSDAGERT